MVEVLHLLNGCLIVPAALGVAILLIIQHRRGRGLTPASLAAVLLVSLQIFTQLYLGVMLLNDRGQRSLLHYSLGLIPLLLLLITFWLLPQMGRRAALVAGIVFLVIGMTATLAYLIG
jgi:hypothetical protein